MHLLLMAAAAYLLGCVPAASLAGKLVRGPWGRAAGAVADTLKGVVAASYLSAPGPLGLSVAVTMVVAGHQYPLAGKRASRGLGVLAGASLPVTPVAVPLGAVIWGVVYATTGYVQLGAILAAGLTPVAVGFLAGWPLAVMLAPASLLVLLRCRGPLRNLLTGREPRHLWRGGGNTS